MIIELRNPLPMATPKGYGMCYFLQDIGLENDYLWTVIQDNGEIWTWRNRDVRVGQNRTLGRINAGLDLNADQKARLEMAKALASGKITELPKE